jgi:hypothetical protein
MLACVWLWVIGVVGTGLVAVGEVLVELRSKGNGSQKVQSKTPLSFCVAHLELFQLHLSSSKKVMSCLLLIENFLVSGS